MLTNQQLLDLVNYYPGGCLCGHFESCSVCSRTQGQRTLEQNARISALEVLKYRGVNIEEKNGEYVLVIPPEPTMPGIAAISSGFAKIQGSLLSDEYNHMVGRVLINPDNRAEFFSLVTNSSHGSWFEPEGNIIGWLWGSQVKTDATIPTGVVRLMVEPEEEAYTTDNIALVKERPPAYIDIRIGSTVEAMEKAHG